MREESAMGLYTLINSFAGPLPGQASSPQEFISQIDTALKNLPSLSSPTLRSPVNVFTNRPSTLDQNGEYNEVIASWDARCSSENSRLRQITRCSLSNRFSACQPAMAQVMILA
jgi:hypothetical protein